MFEGTDVWQRWAWLEAITCPQLHSVDLILKKPLNSGWPWRSSWGRARQWCQGSWGLPPKTPKHLRRLRARYVHSPGPLLSLHTTCSPHEAAVANLAQVSNKVQPGCSAPAPFRGSQTFFYRIGVSPAQQEEHRDQLKLPPPRNESRTQSSRRLG